ncbi:hypothetical protein Phi4:1_gp162 [Cellulophaga phage phi4:1]|uniref:Transmembrane protein n=3 Tax=Lightbulbvirus Cba41 TaxID=1918524 RepID=A0A0S2MWR5_9CAUD|nr:hypothetical protein Phi4:1_gp162 [Cellulophaga phage phi4:1]AGO49575.1 hypothetical protein Phi4:1_gp162 [Cellulophaga phage phi4:1]ALO80171.1 hypothetical protein Phi4113_162 [Cellulophaga phage phi4:1_13]ALO80368.1 hypothetical protein Phi4118_162 [Cellulophaga phage phi4:1_18]
MDEDIIKYIFYRLVVLVLILCSLIFAAGYFLGQH